MMIKDRQHKYRWSTMPDLLGVSVHYLATTFLEEVLSTPELGRESTIYDVEDLENDTPGLIRQKGSHVVCPLDGRMGAAYVHCISGEDNVGRATFMLSYSWGYQIGSIVDCLLEFCACNNRDTKRSYVWICCLCVNQHRVWQQKQNYRSGMLAEEIDFFAEFGERVKGIGHLLAMMSPWHSPTYLQRMWCIFEMYSAYTNNCDVTIVMPPAEHASLKRELVGKGGRGIDSLYDALARTQVQKAKAYAESDRLAILSVVANNPGYQALNQQINVLLREWVRDVLSKHSRVKEGERGEETLPFAEIFTEVGHVFFVNGEFDAALNEYNKAMPIFERDCGVSSPNVASLLSSMGEALNAKGDDETALVYYKKALSIQVSTLGEMNAETAVTRSNIGNLLRELGKYPSALKEHQQALQIRRVLLHDKHPDIASSHCNIGTVLKKMGLYKKALVEHQKALAIREAVLGSRHPATAKSYSKMGIALRAKGDHDAALSKFHAALEIRELVLGKDHPDTAKLFHHVGHTLSFKGQQNHKFLKLVLHKLGDPCLEVMAEDPNKRQFFTAVDRRDAPRPVNRVTRVLESALLYLQKALNIRVVALGDMHPDTSTTKNWIAYTQQCKRNYEADLDKVGKLLCVEPSYAAKTRKKMKHLSPDGEVTQDVVDTLRQYRLIYSGISFAEPKRAEEKTWFGKVFQGKSRLHKT